MNTDTGHTWESREPAMHEVLNAARIMTSTEVSTLNMGERGSRQQAPFVAVNCGALALFPDQAESLFFEDCSELPNDTKQPRRGYVHAAAAAPARGGARSLPPGTTLPLPVDARIVAASHRFTRRAVSGRTGVAVRVTDNPARP